MATKQVKRFKPLKHPLSKAKLKVLDSFTPSVQADQPWPAHFSCPSCSKPIRTIMLVESESKDSPPYYVLECLECKKQSWYVQMAVR